MATGMEAGDSHVLKVLVLGDPGTGKTSIIKRYVHNIFSPQHKTTVGVDFHLKNVMLGETTVRLQLWDIAGQERFGAIARVYYKDAYGAMLVYDVSEPKTFDTVAKWKDEIDAKVVLPNNMPLPVVLLGNKCDKDGAEVDKSQLDRFCEEKGFETWFDTSAKLGLNIDNAAKCLVERILQHKDIFQKKKAQQDTFTPGAGNRNASKGSGCC